MRGHIATAVNFAGLAVGILYPRPIAEWANSAFRHLEIAGGTADAQLQVVVRGDRFQLFRNGESLLSCSALEVFARVIGSAKIWSLTYSRLNDAVVPLGQAWR